MKYLQLTLCFLFLISCAKDTPQVVKEVESSPPLFPNSIVSTDIDFIQVGDPDASLSFRYVGQENKEMPDSRNDVLFDTDAYIFEAIFTDDTKVEIWAHSSFTTVQDAEVYAEKLVPRLGKLPSFMRETLSHVVLHKGDAGAFSEAESHFIILYSDNMDTRISNNDLEETVFHETVHASLDALHANSTEWNQAQAADKNFITEYASSFPIREDLAESAIFTYTMIKHPGRLSVDTEAWVRDHVPNRLAFLKTIFE